MTRSTLRHTLRRIYILLVLLLGFSFFAKIADHMPLLAGTGFDKMLKDVYEFLRDMSLLIATGGVAYITNVFQKRHAFVDSLKEEWRDIIAAKSALLSFMHKETPSHEEYVAAFTRLSETIDNMRVVYRNTGETESLIGLYPYAPLHDMRRALQTLDPRSGTPTAAQRKLARDAMLQSFYALRDPFLEELDLEEADQPLLMSAARRVRKPGAAAPARKLQDRQIRRHANMNGAGDDTDAYLRGLYEAETTKNTRPEPVQRDAER
jgi:hypothetical protein